MTVQEYEDISKLLSWEKSFLQLVKTIKEFPEDQQPEMIKKAVEFLKERAKDENNNDC